MHCDSRRGPKRDNRTLIETTHTCEHIQYMNGVHVDKRVACIDAEKRYVRLKNEDNREHEKQQNVSVPNAERNPRARRQKPSDPAYTPPSATCCRMKRLNDAADGVKRKKMRNHIASIHHCHARARCRKRERANLGGTQMKSR